MKNLLTLHEAIVIAIINIDKDDFIATFKEISENIEIRKLYPNHKGGVELASDVKIN